MIKTAKQIQGDVYRFLSRSELATIINGKVYRGTPEDSSRPKDSESEDAVVIFTAGFVDDIQSGVVTINIFVQDLEINGSRIENGQRCEEIEIAAQNWVDSLTAADSNYLFDLAKTISTYKSRERKEHFVNIQLNYRLYNN